MTTTLPTIIPVILSGGSGTRLWPMSRPERPKQLLSLTAAETMLQLTASRVPRSDGFEPPIVVANALHAEIIEEQLKAIGIEDVTLVLEPLARNTAPAIALAALAASNPGAALLIMPSDHVIADVPVFHDAIQKALPLAAEGWLLTFGITADAPETGYGYIHMTDPLQPGVAAVDRFVEKPTAIKAAEMLAEGNYCWNAGIFLFRADTYLDALAKFAPDMLAAAQESMDKSERYQRRILPDGNAFAKSPDDSIDYAIMEQSDKVACVPISCGWSDVGSWDSLHQISERDTAGNSIKGNVTAVDVNNCFIRTDGPNVALVGVSDLIVIAEANNILILPRGQSQNVRKITDLLKAKADPVTAQ